MCGETSTHLFIDEISVHFNSEKLDWYDVLLNYYSEIIDEINVHFNRGKLDWYDVL